MPAPGQPRKKRGSHLDALVDDERRAEEQPQLESDMVDDPIRAALRAHLGRKEQDHEEFFEASPMDSGDEEEEPSLEEEGDVDDNAEAISVLPKKPQKKRGRAVGSQKSWVFLPSISAVVPLDRTKLSPKAISMLPSNPKELPDNMRLCLIPAESSTPHFAGMLYSASSTNPRLHYKNHHASLFVWMEKAAGENIPFEQAFENFLVAHRQGNSTKTMRQMSLVNFSKRTNVSAGILSMELGAQKEIMQVLRLIETDSSMSSMDTPLAKMWGPFLGVKLPNSQGCADRVTLIAMAVRELREEQLQNAQFFSTTFDFASIQNSQLLLLTYHYIERVSWDLRSIILDVIDFPGKHFASSIAIAAQVRINRHTNDSTMLVNATTDGAANVKKASRILVGNMELLEAEEITVEELIVEIGEYGDAGLCFCHGEHLGVTDTLGTKTRPAKATTVARDLDFIHSLALYFKTYPEEESIFMRLQREDNVARPLKLLGIECETRWPDRYLAIQRANRVRKYLEWWYMESAVSFSNDANVPPDALLPPFWKRNFATERVLEVFNDVSLMFQSEKSIVIDLYPRSIHLLRNACVFIEDGVGIDGDCGAVRELKTSLLAGVEKYLVPMMQMVSNPLKAAALSPNEANMGVYGVSDEVINDTWCSIAEEVGNYAPAHAQIAKALVGSLRAELDMISAQVQSGERERMDVLEFWRTKSQQPTDESLIGPVFASTARAILCSQISSAASERRVKAIRRIMTTERSNMDMLTIEDRLVIRDWITEEPFTKEKFDELVQKVAEISAREHKANQ